MTLDASSSAPDSSAIFFVTVFEVTTVVLPSVVSVVRSLIAASVFASVCPIALIFATICSTDSEDSATFAACASISVFNCLMVYTIPSIVAAVLPTLLACVIACCFIPLIFALI